MEPKDVKSALNTHVKLKGNDADYLFTGYIFRNIISEYSSACDAEKITGICHQQISRCCQGTMKSAHGYVWAFKEV